MSVPRNSSSDGGRPMGRKGANRGGARRSNYEPAARRAAEDEMRWATAPSADRISAHPLGHVRRHLVRRHPYLPARVPVPHGDGHGRRGHALLSNWPGACSCGSVDPTTRTGTARGGKDGGLMTTRSGRIPILKLISSGCRAAFESDATRPSEDGRRGVGRPQPPSVAAMRFAAWAHRCQASRRQARRADPSRASRPSSATIARVTSPALWAASR